MVISCKARDGIIVIMQCFRKARFVNKVFVINLIFLKRTEVDVIFLPWWDIIVDIKEFIKTLYVHFYERTICIRWCMHTVTHNRLVRLDKHWGYILFSRIDLSSMRSFYLRDVGKHGPYFILLVSWYCSVVNYNTWRKKCLHKVYGWVLGGGA